MFINVLRKLIHLTLIFSMIAVPTQQSAWAMMGSGSSDDEGSSRKGKLKREKSAERLLVDIDAEDVVQGSDLLEEREQVVRRRRGGRVSHSEGTAYVEERGEWFVIDEESRERTLKLIDLQDARVLGGIRKFFDKNDIESPYTDDDSLAFGGAVVDIVEPGANFGWTNRELLVKATDTALLHRALKPFRPGRVAWEIIGALFEGAAIVGYTNIVSGATFNTLRVPMDGSGEAAGLIIVMALEIPFLLVDGWKLGESVHKFLVRKVGKSRTLCGVTFNPFCCFVKRGPHKDLGFKVGHSEDGNPWYYKRSKREYVMMGTAVMSGVSRAAVPIALFLGAAMGEISPATVILAVTMAPPLLHMYVSSALRASTRLFQRYNWGNGENEFKRRLMLGRSERLIEKLLKNDQKSRGLTRYLFDLVAGHAAKRMQESGEAPMLENDLIEAIIGEFASAEARRLVVQDKINEALPYNVRPGPRFLGDERKVRKFIGLALKDISADGSFYLKRIKLLQEILGKIRDAKTDGGLCLPGDITTRKGRELIQPPEEESELPVDERVVVDPEKFINAIAAELDNAYFRENLVKGDLDEKLGVEEDIEGKLDVSTYMRLIRAQLITLGTPDEKAQFLKEVLELIIQRKSEDLLPLVADTFESDDLIDIIPEQLMPVFSLLMLKGATLTGDVPNDPKLHLGRERGVVVERMGMDFEEDDGLDEESPLLSGRGQSINTELHQLRRRNESLADEAESMGVRYMVLQRDLDTADQREGGWWSKISSGVSVALGFGGFALRTFVFKWALRLLLTSAFSDEISSGSGYMDDMTIDWISEGVGAVLAGYATLDFEDVRRAVFSMKEFFSTQSDFWVLRRMTTLYSSTLAFMFCFIEVAIGLDELTKAIHEPALRYTIIGLGGANAFFAAKTYIDMRMQNAVTGMGTFRSLENTRGLMNKRAWLIHLVREWQKCLRRFDHETISNIYSRIEDQ